MIGPTLPAALLVVATPVQAEPQEISPEDLAAIRAGPVFTPMTVRPEITNRAQVRAALMREYPAELRASGIGGVGVVWFYISETGRNLHNRISRGSGRQQLDEAALDVAAGLQFTPAMDARVGSEPGPVYVNEPVAVWIEIPITFAVQGR